MFTIKSLNCRPLFSEVKTIFKKAAFYRIFFVFSICFHIFSWLIQSHAEHKIDALLACQIARYVLCRHGVLNS